MVDGSTVLAPKNATKVRGFLSKSEGNLLGDFEEFILASDVNHDSKVDDNDVILIAQYTASKAEIDQNYYVSDIKDLQIIYNEQ